MQKLIKLSLSFLLLSLPFSATAQTLDSEHKAWSVFTIKQDGEKICYITSAPVKKTGNYKRRAKPYILVTYRKGAPAEVSVNSGYPYKKDSEVTLTTGKSKYALFTTEETPKIAWAKTSKDDDKIVKNMIKGTKIIAKAKSRLGSHSTDTYSLSGFTKAYNRMKALCKK